MATRKDMATKQSTEMMDWESEMKRDAELAAGMEARIGSTQFFSTRGGQLKFNDAPVPDNEMAVVVLDYVFEKAWYDEDFDPDNPTAPACFALGRGDEHDLAPHEDSEAAQSDGCKDCDWNKFGSADKGKGKACKDSRRLGLISAGKRAKDGDWEINDEPEDYETQDMALLRIPPTSLKAWASYVKQLKGALGRPPYGVVTIIKVEPDPKNQFIITFTCAGTLPDGVMPTIFKRHKACLEPNVIDFPYQNMDVEEEEAPRRTTRKKATTKKATTRKKTAARSRSRKY